jgi:2-polyprenyl-3-methyl-5-hydroxy-6-metoxy-1,4-benzoquinol methylase
MHPHYNNRRQSGYREEGQTMTTATINEEKLNALVGQCVMDLGAIVSAGLVVIGDQLGLYKALNKSGPVTPVELAVQTGTNERYLRHWLLNQASSGYITYSPDTGRYSLTPEQAMVFADDDSPAAMLGGFTVTTAAVKAQPRIAEAFKTGAGIFWGDQDPSLAAGTARFFKPGYIGNITQSWIPSLTGVQEKLERGAKVADVGCGFGISTVIMAKAFPNSRFVGYDTHEPSIAAARKNAAEAGVSDRVTFEVASAQDFHERDLDLIAYFDCLHDMGDPEGAVRHARQALKQDGSVMLVEPMAGDRVEDNLNPVGRIYSGASVLICTPHAIAETGKALGTLVTDAEWRAVFQQAGFTNFRRAAETPTNRVFEAR